MNSNKKYYMFYDLGQLSKEMLLKDLDLVMGLVRWNEYFGKHDLAQDLEVLKLCDGKVALGLAYNSLRNGWDKTSMAQDPKVLALCNGQVAVFLSSDFVELKKDNHPRIYIGREWKEGERCADEFEAMKLAYKKDLREPVWTCVNDGDVNHCLVVCEKGIKFDRRDVWEMSDDVWFWVHDFLSGNEGNLEEEKRMEVREWIKIIECEKIDFKVYSEYIADVMEEWLSAPFRK